MSVDDLRFANGTLSPLDVYFSNALGWADGEDLDAVLRRHGYELAWRIGERQWPFEGDAFAICYRSTSPTAPARFAVKVGLDIDGWTWIVADDATAAFELHAKLARQARDLAIAERMDSLERLARQAFEAWHGHDAAYPCKECSFGEWQAEQARLKRKGFANRGGSK
jgi:hypothetical protein